MSKNKKVTSIKLSPTAEVYRSARKTWAFRPTDRIVPSKKLYKRVKFDFRKIEEY